MKDEIVAMEAEETNKPSSSNQADGHDEHEGESSPTAVKGGTKNQAAKRSVSTLKLLSFADPLDVVLMIIATLGSIGAGAATPFQALVFGQLITAFGATTGNSEAVKRAVAQVAIRFVYVGCGAGIANFLGSALWIISAERQSARIRALYLQSILRQDISFFDKEINSGDVVSRISREAVCIQQAINGKIVETASQFLAGLVIAFVKSWKLSLVMVSMMPIMSLVSWQMASQISRIAAEGEISYSNAAKVVDQVLGGIRTVASYTGEKKAVEKYSKALVDAEKTGVRANVVVGIGMGLVLSLKLCSYALAIWYCSHLVAARDLSAGNGITALFAIIVGGTGLINVSPHLKALGLGRAAAYGMFEVIHRKPDIDSTDPNGVTFDVVGAIELKNVHFSYPTRPEIAIFRDFSLAIKSGTTAALVGESGSGKSTVVSLIERFYDPQDGAVFIDGIDIRTMQLRWLRLQIALVSQEPVLFGTTIGENISYGKDGTATLDEIKSAAALANAAGFIESMPQGYETQVGERGTQLSGGQKQRVAIARAILKNSPILLLDEATSALDSESERTVQAALDRVMGNRTTVVVAHRLSTIKNADCIAVVSDGAILEIGTHHELTQSPDSAYNQLIRLQEMKVPGEHAAEVKEEDTSANSSRSTTRSVISDTDIEAELSTRSDSRRLEAQSRSKRLNMSSRRQPSLVLDIISNLGHSSRSHRREEFLLDPEDIEKGRSRSRRIYHVLDEEAAAADANNYPALTEDPFKRNFYKENTRTKKEKSSMFRLAALNKPELGFFALGGLASSVTGAILPLYGYFLASVIGDLFQTSAHEIRKEVGFWSLMFVVLAVMQLISAPVDATCFGIAGSKLIRRVRTDTFDKVVRQEIAWFDDEKNSSGALSARLNTDAATVRNLVGDSVTILIRNFSTVMVGLILAFSNDWKLSLVIIGIIPLLGMQGVVMVAAGGAVTVKAETKYEAASRVAYDAVSNIRTVVSYCAEERIRRLFSKTCRAPVISGMKLGVVSGIGQGLASFTLFAGYALGFWAGSRFVVSTHTVFKVFLSIALSAMSIAQSLILAPDMTKAKAAVSSIFTILDRNSKIDPTSDAGITLPALKGKVEFQNVIFNYPTRPETPILQNLSFTVLAGQTLALVGSSGSGKSTVISLLQRFYDADSGSILIDGTEISSLQVKWLRQCMGLVSQEPVLFDDSIRANIVYGKDELSADEDVESAAQAANAHNFIQGLPEKYETRVGERGVQLSGGQKQRVAIARAILKDPKILLLDEATSALDAESEHVVQEALDRIVLHRTTVVVAHRLSAVKNCDQIAVIRNGLIVEKGGYEELLRKPDGAFTALHQLHNAK